MLIKNYVEVPATQQEDINGGLTRWIDGRCVSLDEGTHVTFYIGHRDIQVVSRDPESGEDVTRDTVEAFAVRVPKPVTRDMAINAAEMAAYGLNTAMEVASFNASLARKSRANAKDPEVAEHDEFIAWVKEELTGIGV